MPLIQRARAPRTSLDSTNAPTKSSATSNRASNSRSSLGVDAVKHPVVVARDVELAVGVLPEGRQPVELLGWIEVGAELLFVADPAAGPAQRPDPILPEVPIQITPEEARD